MVILLENKEAILDFFCDLGNSLTLIVLNISEFSITDEVFCETSKCFLKVNSCVVRDDEQVMRVSFKL